MKKYSIPFVAFFCLALASTAHAQVIPAQVNIRYSAQVSNSPVGTCGCFTMEGVAGDLYLGVKHFAGAGLGVVADVGVEHTGNENGAGYGLTLTTLAFGPRVVLLPVHKLHPFAQVLVGFARGAQSEFPKNNALVSSATSLALYTGGGADYSVNKRISVRLVQAEYLRTDLPNNSNNWQNNLRIGAGITLHLSH